MKLIENSIDAENLQTSISHGELEEEMASCEIAQVNGKKPKEESSVEKIIEKAAKIKKLTNGVHEKVTCNGNTVSYYDEISEDDDFELVLESSSDEGASPRKKIDEDAISAPQIVQEIEDLLGINSSGVDIGDDDDLEKLVCIDSNESLLNVNEKDSNPVIKEITSGVPQEIQDVFEDQAENSSRKSEESCPVNGKKTKEKNPGNGLSETAECDSSSNMNLVFDEVEIGTAESAELLDNVSAADADVKKLGEGSNEGATLPPDVVQSNEVDCEVESTTESHTINKKTQAADVLAEQDRSKESINPEVDEETERMVVSTEKTKLTEPVQEVEDCVPLTQGSNISESSVEWAVIDSVETSDEERKQQPLSSNCLEDDMDIADNESTTKDVAQVDGGDVKPATAEETSADMIVDLKSKDEDYNNTSPIILAEEVQRKRSASEGEDEIELKKPKLEGDKNNTVETSSQILKRPCSSASETIENESKRTKFNDTSLKSVANTNIAVEKIVSECETSSKKIVAGPENNIESKLKNEECVENKDITKSVNNETLENVNKSNEIIRNVDDDRTASSKEQVMTSQEQAILNVSSSTNNSKDEPLLEKSRSCHTEESPVSTNNVKTSEESMQSNEIDSPSKTLIPMLGDNFEEDLKQCPQSSSVVSTSDNNVAESSVDDSKSASSEKSVANINLDTKDSKELESNKSRETGEVSSSSIDSSVGKTLTPESGPEDSVLKHNEEKSNVVEKKSTQSCELTQSDTKNEKYVKKVEAVEKQKSITRLKDVEMELVEENDRKSSSDDNESLIKKAKNVQIEKNKTVQLDSERKSKNDQRKASSSDKENKAMKKIKIYDVEKAKTVKTNVGMKLTVDDQKPSSSSKESNMLIKKTEIGERDKLKTVQKKVEMETALDQEPSSSITEKKIIIKKVKPEEREKLKTVQTNVEKKSKEDKKIHLSSAVKELERWTKNSEKVKRDHPKIKKSPFDMLKKNMEQKKSETKQMGSPDIATNSEIQKTKIYSERTLPMLKKFHKDQLRKLTRSDLEELVVLKICEAVTDRSEIGQMRLRCQTLEQNNELWRKKAVQFEKQNRELEMVLKRYLTEIAVIKRDNQNRVPTPIKVTRSVGLQVVLASSMHGMVASKQKLQMESSQAAEAFKQAIQQQQSQVARAKQPEKDLSKDPVKAPIFTPPVQPTSNTRGRGRTSRGPQTSSPSNSAPSSPVPPPSKATPPTTPLKAITPAPSKTIPSPGKNLEVIDLTDKDEKAKATPSSVGAPIRVTPPAQFCFVPQSSANSTQQMAYVVQKAGQRQQYLVTAASPSPSLGVCFNSTPDLQSKPAGTPTSRPPPALTLPVFRAGGQLIPVQASPQVGVRSTNNNNTGTMIKRQVPQAIRLQPQLAVLKHPAPLPSTPVSTTKSNKAPPPMPQLKIAKTVNGIMLSWSMTLTSEFAEMGSYQLYAYQETSQPASTSLWKKVGDVKALPLPMACTLTQFIEGHKYHFAVRAVDVLGRFGPFSHPNSILLTK